MNLREPNPAVAKTNLCSTLQLTPTALTIDPTKASNLMYATPTSYDLDSGNLAKNLEIHQQPFSHGMRRNSIHAERPAADRRAAGPAVRAAYTSYPCTRPFAILPITGMERNTSSASATDTACFSAIFPTTCSFQMMSVIRNGCPPNFSF